MELKSISDDDVCASCMHRVPCAGDMSRCQLSWPGDEDADGYITECASFSLVENEGEA